LHKEENHGHVQIVKVVKKNCDAMGHEEKHKMTEQEYEWQR